MVEKLYEGLFLVDANEAARSWSEVEGMINGLLGKYEAKVEYTERWPDKKLAYPVKGVTKGTYYLAYFMAPTSNINELRRDAELNEKILRLLVIREEWTREEMEKRREAANERAARAEAEPTPAPAPEAPSTDAPAAEAAPAADTATAVAEAPAAEEAPATESAPEPAAEEPKDES